MKNIDSYRKRFFGLLESTMGDVKPLIMEQDSSFSIPSLVLSAITQIEKRFSYMSNGQIIGRPELKGDQMVDIMKNYIQDTIGFDCWNNMSDKLKSQIYSFCFQSDTSVPYKMKFIAGLANSIDSGINRGSIVNKSLNDPNVKSAISLIQQNCENINQYYDNYIKIVDQQYKSMDYNDNYKYIWKYRPTAIDRILSGEDIGKVLNDWDKINQGQSIESDQTTQKETKPITHNSDPETLRQGLKSLGQIYNPKLILNPDTVSVMYEKTGNDPYLLSYVYSNVGEKEKVLKKVKLENNIERETEYNVGSFEGYIIFIMK